MNIVKDELLEEIVFLSKYIKESLSTYKINFDDDIKFKGNYISSAGLYPFMNGKLVLWKEINAINMKIAIDKMLNKEFKYERFIENKNHKLSPKKDVVYKYELMHKIFKLSRYLHNNQISHKIVIDDEEFNQEKKVKIIFNNYAKNFNEIVRNFLPVDEFRIHIAYYDSKIGISNFESKIDKNKKRVFSSKHYKVTV